MVDGLVGNLWTSVKTHIDNINVMLGILIEHFKSNKNKTMLACGFLMIGKITVQ